MYECIRVCVCVCVCVCVLRLECIGVLRHTSGYRGVCVTY